MRKKRLARQDGKSLNSSGLGKLIIVPSLNDRKKMVQN